MSDTLVSIAQDESAVWTGVLESPLIRARYTTRTREGGSYSCVDLFAGIDRINHASSADQHSVGIDDAANRGGIVHMSHANDQGRPGLSVSWRGTVAHGYERPSWNLVVSTEPDIAALRITYRAYHVNIVDQGAPGGMPSGSLVAPGFDRWMDQQQWHELPLYVDGDANVPWFDSERDLSNQAIVSSGCFVLALHDPVSRTGYGRVFPATAVDRINILSAKTGPRGFEVFPYWRRRKQQFSSYLFAVNGDAASALEVGTALARKLAENQHE